MSCHTVLLRSLLQYLLISLLCLWLFDSQKMSVLDVKEKLLLSYVFRYLLIPGIIVIVILHKLRSFLEQGGLSTALLALFGIVSGLRVVLASLRLVYGWWTRRKPKDFVTRYGKWAVVTGSTSGIGMSFAEKLASRGMNILLISRNEDKLKQTASKIMEKHPNAQVQYIVHNFAQNYTDFAAHLESKLQELSDQGRIGVLINAVGVTNAIPSLLHKTPIEDLDQMLRINNIGTLQMTMAVLPFMLQQQAGAIITVSSGSCIHPTPMLSIYSATKAFGHSLTRGLYDLFSCYKDGNIDCLSLRPYYFISNMYARKEATFLVPFPDVISTAALDVLGYEGDAAPYWAHYLGSLLSKWTPHDPAEKILLSMQRARARHLLRKKATSMNDHQ